MSIRPVAALLVALALVPSAGAGGSFERIVGVGSDGRSVVVHLRTDAPLYGPHAVVPRGGYVRVFPFIGGLPAIPGRFYPAARVVCFSWRTVPGSCSQLSGAGGRLLAPFTRLARWRTAPTQPSAVRHAGTLLRYADGNIFAALELALDRPPSARRSAPPGGVTLDVRWRGPRVKDRPSRLMLTPVGVYLPGRLFRLQRGPWCYLVGNLPHAPASLIEASNHFCS